MIRLYRLGSIFLKNNIRYCTTITSTGEWIKKNNNISIIGLTHDSIGQLSEIVYIDPLVEIGDKIEKDGELVALESVKATATINAFNDCCITDINYKLFDNLDIINENPENTEMSWIIKTVP
jgi:glycine cleavage system H lipoate-binding protein